MGREYEKPFPQRGHIGGQQISEKMLSITNYEENAAQNNNKIPVTMAVIKKSTNNMCWQGCGKKGNLVYYWWDCKLIQLLWETGWRFKIGLFIFKPKDSILNSPL